jgi:peptidoglycan/LPS O-acetylase OafA/YrhL
MPETVRGRYGDPMARRWKNRRSRTADRAVAAAIWAFIGFLVVIGIGVVFDTSGALVPWLLAALAVGLLLAWILDRRWLRDHPEDRSP